MRFLAGDGIAVLLDIELGGGASCLPVLAEGPVIGRMRPMVTVASSARAGVAIKAAQIAILAAHLVGSSKFPPVRFGLSPRPAVAYLGTVDFQNRGVALSSCASRASRTDSLLRHCDREAIHLSTRPSADEVSKPVVYQLFKDLWRSGRDAVKSRACAGGTVDCFATLTRTIGHLIDLLGAGRLDRAVLHDRNR